MANYTVHIFCDQCFGTHVIGRIGLDDGPVDRGSIVGTYAGKPLPQEVANLINNYTTCPNTSRLIQQRNNHQVFIVAVGD
jgi:hypothetical protein